MVVKIIKEVARMNKAIENLMLNPEMLPKLIITDIGQVWAVPCITIRQK
jgi:hypothetical protein